MAMLSLSKGIGVLLMMVNWRSFSVRLVIVVREMFSAYPTIHVHLAEVVLCAVPVPKATLKVLSAMVVFSKLVYAAILDFLSGISSLLVFCIQSYSPTYPTSLEL